MPTISSVAPGDTNYDYLVFIGRFQPFHLGHKRVIDKALLMAKNVIILIGSANQPRSYRNPFTFEERQNMIFDSYLENPEAVKKIIITAIEDTPYNDQAWISGVQNNVRDMVLNNLAGNSKTITNNGFKDFKIGLIGCNKDQSSYYLNLFPQWGNEAVKFLNPLNATEIRQQYFNMGLSGLIKKQIPDASFEFLADFYYTDDYKYLVEEHEYVETYKQQWANSPYDPTFVTVDAVVVQSGHVLLVRRGARPGKGQLALPGGFVDQGERISNAVYRELREETGIKVPEPVLRGSTVISNEVFDDPNRSSRGRTITHAFLIKLEDRTELPKVKGGDDAEKAFWVPLSELDPMEMFEDHYHIIQHMVGEA